MIDHNTLMNRIIKLLSHGPVRLFRANAGTAWQCHGRPIPIKEGQIFRATRRGLFLPGASRVALMPEGTSDIIGIKETTVTPDMVGQKIAVAVAIEVKTGKSGLRIAQANFMRQAKKMGVIAGVARSMDDALNILNQIKGKVYAKHKQNTTRHPSHPSRRKGDLGKDGDGSQVGTRGYGFLPVGRVEPDR